MSMKVNNSPPSSISSDWQMECAGMSLHLKFAMLQFKMADANKAQALREMKTIENDQAEQKKIADYMQKLRNSKGSNSDQNAVVGIDRNTSEYLDIHNIKSARPESDRSGTRHIRRCLEKLIEGKNKNEAVVVGLDLRIAYNSCMKDGNHVPIGNSTQLSETASVETISKNIAEMDKHLTMTDTYKIKDLDALIQGLQSRLDTVGTNTQQIMVKAQDAMGKYNSYLGGANSAVQQGNQLTAEVSKMR